MWTPCTRLPAVSALAALATLTVGGCVQAPGGEPLGEQPSCADSARVDERLPLDADGRRPQIHPAVAWDGEALQLVWNGPGDDEGNFGVFRARVRCSGSISERIQVDAGTGVNDVDPSVAVSGGRALVAWQADSGLAPNNLSIGLAPLGLDGDPDRPIRTLEMTREGDSYSGNAWMPRLAADLGGGYVLAGSRGIDLIGRFQGFVQALDADGAARGDSIDVGLTLETTQVEPAIAVRADGGRIVGWEERPDVGVDRVMWTEFAADGAGSGAEILSPSLADELPAMARVGLAVEPGRRQAVVLVAHGGDDLEVALEVVDRGDGAAGPSAVLGVDGRLDHTPGVALHAGGGLVVWHRVVSGLANELIVLPFRLEGDPDAPVAEIGLGEERVIPTERPVAPYPPSVTWVGGDTYFLAWSEGSGTDLEIVGRFITGN